MINFDVESVRICAVKAVQMVVAARMFVKPLGLEYPELEEMERDFRAAAGELQRVERLMKEEVRGPLAKGEGEN